MTPVEWVALLGGGSGAAVALGHLASIARARIEARARAAEAEATVVRTQTIREERVQLAELDGAQRTAEHLWDRVSQLERQRDEDRREHERQRREDREACDEEIERVRSEVGQIARWAAQGRRALGEDDTGVHELEAISGRMSSPIPPRPTPPIPPPPRRDD